MDFPWGSAYSHSFVTTVGLVSSDGPHGKNIMAAEWSFHVSYQPARVAISIGTNRATLENIQQTKKFSLCIPSSDQNSLASLAGAASGKDTDKIAALKEIGFPFKDGKNGLPYPEGTRLHMECTVIQELDTGDHILFIGNVDHAELDETKHPIAYSRGKHWALGNELPKPSDEERARQKAVMEKHRK
jgi:flavin reductase (DIM6/NTAB) family NADH-FMN oxidoreductase RutF